MGETRTKEIVMSMFERAEELMGELVAFAVPAFVTVSFLGFAARLF
jgi:hypothetical protein